MAIPLADGVFSCAQVLVKRKILYLAVFSKLHDEFPRMPECAADTVALVGWSMDAQIYHGIWKILGNIPVIRQDLMRKTYLVLYDGKESVEHFDGELLRPASIDETRTLHRRTSYSPALLEKVIRAFHRIERWDPDFDDLLAMPAIKAD